MYINYNDYELIYLIKEGSEQAKSVIYKKYSYLISKIYREGYYYKKYYYSDFLQEGLMILESVIFKYNNSYNYSFYNFFKICFSRRIIRLNTQSELFFCEKNVKYKIIDSMDVNSNELMHLIKREFMNEDELSNKILKECILENCSFKSFCLKYDLDYRKTYYLYTKIRHKLEKILTK